MVLNIKLSKALPERAIDYAVAKNLLKEPIKRNLFSDKNPTDEMKETASKFGKWNSREERKTFSMIISPNPKDNPTEKQLLEVSEAILDKYFPTIQGFLILHKDRGKDSRKSNPVLHAHFYGSIIDPVTGRNVHLSNKDMKEIRAWADSYAHDQFGWSLFERGNRGRNKYRNLMMQEMVLSDRSSWMRNLVESVEDAYNGALSFSDFERRLRNQGILLEKTDGEGNIKFCINVEGKDIRVNSTTISKRLDWKALCTKFNELEKEDKYGSKRFDQGNTEEIKMGTGPNKREGGGNNFRRDGASGGTESGSIGKQKIIYDCIFCTRDKAICRKCADFKKERGEYSFGSRTR